MAEQHIVHEKQYTKEANLVIPLDQVRTVDAGLVKTVGSGTTTLYAIASGSEAYLKQVSLTELSGTAGEVVIQNVLGSGYTPPIKIAGGQVYILNTCIGPATSGFVVSTTNFHGQASVIVQIDPKPVE